MLESVQREEGRGVGTLRRVIFTGSREWGEEREGRNHQHELMVSTTSITRLIGRWVIGNVDKARDREAVAGPGLVVVQGGARGLDDAVARVTRTIAAGARRMSRAAFAGETIVERHPGLIIERVAPGLILETYPADWANVPRNQAGPERNQRMLDAGADHVIAFFAAGRAYGSGISGGTNDMVRRAVAAGIDVDIYVANDFRWRKP